MSSVKLWAIESTHSVNEILGTPGLLQVSNSNETAQTHSNETRRKHSQFRVLHCILLLAEKSIRPYRKITLSFQLLLNISASIEAHYAQSKQQLGFISIKMFTLLQANTLQADTSSKLFSFPLPLSPNPAIPILQLALLALATVHDVIS